MSALAQVSHFIISYVHFLIFLGALLFIWHVLMTWMDYHGYPLERPCSWTLGDMWRPFLPSTFVHMICFMIEDV